MSIPISTTTVSIMSPSQTLLDAEPYQYAPDSLSGYTVTARGIRAVIKVSNSTSSGQEVIRGGEQAQQNLRLTCDPVAITHLDRVVDEDSGFAYLVLWVLNKPAPLAHIEAGLRRVEGGVG